MAEIRTLYCGNRKQLLYLSTKNHINFAESKYFSGVPCSVTRLGDLLDFEQLFKPVETISMPKSPTFLGDFCKGVKIFNYSSEIIFWATFIHIWQLFTGHTGSQERKGADASFSENNK